MRLPGCVKCVWSSLFCVCIHLFGVWCAYARVCACRVRAEQGTGLAWRMNAVEEGKGRPYFYEKAVQKGGSASRPTEIGVACPVLFWAIMKGMQPQVETLVKHSRANLFTSVFIPRTDDPVSVGARGNTTALDVALNVNEFGTAPPQVVELVTPTAGARLSHSVCTLM
jgi:hypothetical protein